MAVKLTRTTCALSCNKLTLNGDIFNEFIWNTIGLSMEVNDTGGNIHNITNICHCSVVYYLINLHKIKISFQLYNSSFNIFHWLYAANKSLIVNIKYLSVSVSDSCVR
jgi:hypothetical protein